MRSTPALSLIILLFAAASAGAQCTQADTSGQFQDGASRDQCDVGTCHVFGSVALLEAAVFRQHDRRVRLSEADLFAARIGANDAGYYDYVVEGKEGATFRLDLDFAKKNGVAYAEEGDYEAMTARYEEMSPRVDEEKALKLFRRLRPFIGRKMASRFSWMEQRRLDKKNPPPSATDMERELVGGAEALARAQTQRAEVKALLDGFRVDVRDLSPDPADGLPCLKAGAEGRRFIVEQLCRLPLGAPVGIGIELKGLDPEWQAADGRHGFVVTGFKTTPGGLVFETRNSWGGRNPPLRDFQLCKLTQVAALITKSEIPLPATDQPKVPADGGARALGKAPAQKALGSAAALADKLGQ